MTTTTTEPDQQQGQTPPDTDNDNDQHHDDAADEPLGPAGVKALEAEKARRREEADRRRKATADLQAAQGEVAKLREQLAKASGAEQPGPDLEQLRAEATRAAMATANQRIVAAELRAAATGRLTDPTDAVAFLADQLGTVDVDTTGAVDSQQLTDMLDDLLARKPHLAVPAAAPQRFTGTANGGPRSPAEPKTLSHQIAAAEAAGDYSTAQRLKAAQLSEMRGQ